MRRRLSLLVALATGAAGLAAPAARAVPASEPGPAAVAGELLVGYAPGASDDARSRARARVDARLAERLVSGPAGAVERVVLPHGRERGQAIAALQSDPSVAYAEPNYLVRVARKPTPAPTQPAVPVVVEPVTGNAQDPLYLDGRTWGLQGGAGSGADKAWPAATPTVTTYVGVIDEGIDVDHPDLAGRVWTNPSDPVNGKDDDLNGYVDDVHGWDFAGGNASVYDGPGDDHGTHVAGTIAARHDTVGVPGVASGNVQLISAKFLGEGGGTTANAVKAVDYVTALKKRGMNVVATNNSWGGGGASTALRDAIARGAQAGILFVAAAGNDGLNTERTPSYPSAYDTTSLAGYDAVVAVAATDRAAGLASFSNYAATRVDLGAPGVGILSTVPGGGHASYNGTSMATPHVAGAVALYAAAKPGRSAQQVRAALLGSAVPTTSLNGKTATGGRLDVPAMLAR